MPVIVGVLALQGGFAEHVAMLQQAAAQLRASGATAETVDAVTVRTPAELAACDALIIPGGESTTMALIAERSGLMQPLRDFVRTDKKPTWGTCAGLIFLAREATGTKTGGQQLIGGLDVRVHRNHFGRQKESFVADVPLPFLAPTTTDATDAHAAPSFPAVFIRAPVVEALLPPKPEDDTSDSGVDVQAEAAVRVLAVLPPRRPTTPAPSSAASPASVHPPAADGDIVAVQQNNILGTSFHPELTNDSRLHAWWLRQVLRCP